MSLKHLGYVELPLHQKNGGFDHAAVHEKSGTIYVAHTANDSLDLIDGRHDKYLRSVPNLPGVAGALVSDETDLVFTSNRGEKTVGIFRHGQEEDLEKVTVGGYPNGLAFDPRHQRLIAANVTPNDSSLVSCSIVDTDSRNLIADIIVPGRTRWTIFDEKSGRFYVNIAKPSKIVAINSNDLDGIVAGYDIPGVGPHGLDLDSARRRLFCACDGGQLYIVELITGRVVKAASLSGPPDVIFHNAKKRHLYVAVGDPGVIDVINTENMRVLQTVTTELGAHTIAYASELSKVYALLPGSHRASVYLDP